MVDKNRIRMSFVFDNEKLANEGLTEEQCLNSIRVFFEKNKKKEIVEIEKGVFEGSDDEFTAFSLTTCFHDSDWFLKVIKEWYWWIAGEQEDCLEAYYRVAE